MKKFLITVLVASLLAACSKQKDKMRSEITSTPFLPQHTRYEEINKSIDHAALIVARSLKDQVVRSFIKAEALKRKTGDYDVVFKWVEKTPINGSTLGSIFSAHIGAKLSGINSFEDIISEIPNFQISVPRHCSNWDANNYTPLVAIRELGVNEKQLKQIKAYDSDGNVHLLDARNAPDMPVVTVGVSERVDEKGNSKYSVEPSNAAASRYSGQTTMVGAVLATDVDDLETWSNGDVELVLRVYGAKLSFGFRNPSANLIYQRTFYLSMFAINNVWGPINANIFNWNKTWPSSANAVFGTEVKFYWIEDDADIPILGDLSLPQPVTINGSILASDGTNVSPVAVGTAFTYGITDVNCGSATVLYTDATPAHIYTTSGGNLKFKID